MVVLCYEANLYFSDALQNENTEPTAPSRTITQFSSFRPSKKNHRIKDGGVLELRLEESEVRTHPDLETCDSDLFSVF